MPQPVPERARPLGWVGHPFVSNAGYLYMQVACALVACTSARRGRAAKPRRPWPAQLAPILSWNSRQMETPRPRDKERLRVVSPQRVCRLPMRPSAYPFPRFSALLWMTMRCTAHAMLSSLVEEKEGKGAPTPTPTRVNYCAESCYRARHVLATRYLPTYRTVA